MTQYSDWSWKKYFVEIHSWSVISTSNQKISKARGAPSSSSKWQKIYHSSQWSTRAKFSACCEDTEHRRWLAKANKSTKKWSNIKTSSKTKYKESRLKMTTRACFKSIVSSKINTTHLWKPNLRHSSNSSNANSRNCKSVSPWWKCRFKIPNCYKNCRTKITKMARKFCRLKIGWPRKRAATSSPSTK